MKVALLADPASVHTLGWVERLQGRGHSVAIFSAHKAPAPPALRGITTVPLAELLPPAASGPAPPLAPAADRAALDDEVRSLRLRTISRALRLGPAFRAWLDSRSPDLLLALRLQPEAYVAALAYAPWGSVTLPGRGDALPFATVSWGQDVLRFARSHLLHRFCSRLVFRMSDRLYGEHGEILEVMRKLGASPRKLRQRMPGLELAEWMPSGPSGDERTAALASLRSMRPEWSGWIERAASGAAVLLSPRAVNRAGHQRELVAAWTRAPESLLLLAGAGVEEERRVCAARAERARERYFDLGLVSRAELRLLYRVARVTASLWVPDGVAQTLLETMASGSLPLVSRTPGNLEWIRDGENGLLVDPTQVDALARTLRDALADDALVERARSRNAGIVRARADRGPSMNEWIEELERLR